MIKNIFWTASLAMSLAGCATDFTPPPMDIRADAVTSGVNVKSVDRGVLTIELDYSKNLIAKFKGAYDDSYDNTTDAAKASLMADSGIKLLEYRCDNFFHQIGGGAQRLDFIRRQIEAVDGVTIAALGTAGVSAAAVTGVGLAGNFGLKSVDNFSDVYFFSPDVQLVQNLVGSAQDALRTTIFSAGHAPKTFFDGIEYLRQFQNICTAQNIKHLVNASVDNSTVKPSVTATTVSEAQAVLAGYTDYVAQKLGVLTVSVQDIALLSTRFELTDGSEDNKICALLDDAVRVKFCTTVAGTPTNYSMQDPNADPTNKMWDIIRSVAKVINEIDSNFLDSLAKLFWVIFNRPCNLKILA